MNINSEISYFAWVMAYEMNVLELGKKYNITECDVIYDFCNDIAKDYINSSEYSNLKYSSYDMFYKYIDSRNGLENIFKTYFQC